jgi:putative spermidine/putrescine transport system substrate-binding protein
MRSISRREFVRGAAGAAAVLAAWPAMAACNVAPGASSGPSTFRIMLNGGSYEDTSRRAVLDKFAQDNNVKFEVLPALSAEMLTRVRAEKDSPTVDAVVWDDIVAVVGRADGLVEKLDYNNIPNMKDLDPQADYKDGFSPAVHANVAVFAYNPALVKVEPPKGYKDLWDPRFKGMIVAASPNTTSGVLFILQSAVTWGGSYENIDPGFDATKRIQPNMMKYYTAIGDVIPLLKDQACIVVGGISQVAALQQQGTKINVVFPEEGSPSFPAVVDLVKGTKLKAVGEKLINAYLDPKAQGQIAKEQNWVVFSKKAEIDPDTKAKIPPKPIVYDPYKIAKYREEWAARWKREIGGV